MPAASPGNERGNTLNLNRRDFIAGSLASATSLAAGTAFARNAKRSPVVDTHLHCFAGTKSERFPYHARAPYQPEKPATPQYLLKCMDGAGVDFAVVVHPEPYQDDHRYLEHCLNIGKQRLKGTCLFFCDRPGSLPKMPALVKRQPGRMIAARLHSYAPGRLPPYGKPELIRALWKQASDLGLAMQLHFEPRYATALEPYLKEFPKTTVIIDHLGRPFQGTPKEHAVVIRWARLPNTIMKIASLPPRSRYPHRDIAPVIKTLTNAYGADRMIYGGGFNGEATPESYRAYRDHVTELLAHLSAEDQAKILGGTAARIYKFGKNT
jgi:predicted TIM-barrel fold metal-dependent hydrolase